MKQRLVINLSREFVPFGESIRNNFPYCFSFPSGVEPHIKIDPLLWSLPVIITSRITSMDDLIRLFLATDALKRMGVLDIEVFIPYLPFARQDRIMVPGEPLSVKVIADLINLQGYNKVMIYDVHSDVAPAVINNCHVVSNQKFVSHILTSANPGYYILSPDAGAYKKIFALCKAIGYKNEIVVCSKSRNVSTGDIVATTMSHDNLNGRDVYIIDDICSRGGTFIGIANELKKRNCGGIYLIVSHYENTANPETLRASGISMVYKTNSMNDFENDIVKNIKLDQHGLLS